MSRWADVRTDIDAARTGRKSDWCNALIVQIQRAVKIEACGRMAPYWVKRASTGIIEIAGGDAVMKTVKAEVPAMRLQNLPALDDALLTFRVVLQKDGKRVAQYTMSVVGTDKVSKKPWYVRIDLDPEQRGAGPCGHPMLHCHVGETEKGGQETRVPLPWLGPDDALAWILATVEPKLEP